VDKFEIASELRISVEKDIISIQLNGFIFNDFYENLQQLSMQDSLLLSPIVSALACALAKATKKVIAVENIDLKSQDFMVLSGVLL
jgi:hypothetical protein